RLVGGEAALAVLRVHAAPPAAAELLVERAAGEGEPRPVEPLAQAIRPGHPDHDRGAIRHRLEARLALRHRAERDLPAARGVAQLALDAAPLEELLLEPAPGPLELAAHPHQPEPARHDKPDVERLLRL